ncbi:chorismate synthase [Streptococcus urinalis FB127-CNA-2]|uniref:Chorismate synthase n=1 Tax=Streptococcus urinalis 2285-97 TaxID=764291 RepID=G5KFA9_9STRE|nr:chorismate synthase [Streptococcus urinalis]EHJ57169.1 chorismate synthase [Streptococcus urinalis 2285-97]EKS22011.1 chorismate synthase [Streptococcus urinalis FB127-CNA-2]VEF31823.1 chorismate synthase [Streptococcus urinalis]
MRYLTAGESHGPQLTAIIEGLPAGIDLSVETINQELTKRQGGYGRGQRMKIESDQVTFLSGLRFGKTTGAPLTMVIENKDHKKWTDIMSIDKINPNQEAKRRVHHPRPGHADLVGGIKYHYQDLRNSLERSSARETAIRVAIGAISKQILSQLGIELVHYIKVFGGITIDIPKLMTISEMKEAVENSEVGILNPEKESDIKNYIDQIKKEGDTIGGIIETVVFGLPAGVGSFMHWDRKLDAKLAQAVISINAFKGVEFGDGFELGYQKGSQVMDSIVWSETSGYSRTSNHLGGFEGGVTNGMPLIVRGVMKPIPTLYKPLMSVDIDNHKPYKATVERSDPTALPAAGVVMESVIATTLVTELLDQFHSDTMEGLIENYQQYKKAVLDF